jgi:hypothetical protein
MDLAESPASPEFATHFDKKYRRMALQKPLKTRLQLAKKNP